MPISAAHPTLLTGYGGFDTALKPTFSLPYILLIQHFNVTVAMANLRGSGEYGEQWHRAGMRHKKQNVFDDFIAADEYLIAEGRTSAAQLAIEGASNGGLLVAAVAQQRPNLFAAVLPRVGVMDMLRFHKFTIGAEWLSEYGNPEEHSTDFRYIYRYSPLHNIRLPTQGQLPAMMLMTADHDDRVVPSHSLKYMAQLYHTVRQQHSTRQTRSLIIRIEVNAGHGAGKPTSKSIYEIVDVDSFLVACSNCDGRNDGNDCY